MNFRRLAFLVSVVSCAVAWFSGLVSLFDVPSGRAVVALGIPIHHWLRLAGGFGILAFLGYLACAGAFSFRRSGDHDRPSGLSPGTLSPRAFPRRRRIRTVGGVMILLSLAFLARLPHLTDPFYRDHAWNEGHFAMTALNFTRFGWMETWNDLGHDHTYTPLVPWMAAAGARLVRPLPFQSSDLVPEAACRLPIVVCGLLALLVFYSYCRRLFRSLAPALLALAFGATTPAIVYFSRNFQLDTPAILGLLAALWAWDRAFTRGPLRVSWLLLGGAAFGLSVFVKHTFAFGALPLGALVLTRLPRSSRCRLRTVGAAGVVGFLAMLPALVWTVCSLWADPGRAGEFFVRAGERAPGLLLHSVSQIPSYLVWHATVPLLLLSVLGLFLALRHSRRRFLPLIVLALFWLVFPITHPAAYLANRYYDLPGLYACCALAAWAVLRIAFLIRRRQRSSASRRCTDGLGVTRSPQDFGRRGERTWSTGRLLSTSGFLLAAGLALVPYLLVSRAGSFGRLSLKGAALEERYPFASAHSARLVVDQLSLQEGPYLLVDYPQTMYYSGGDPRRVRCAYGDVRAHIDEGRYALLLLNHFPPTYPIDDVLRNRLHTAGYEEFTPLLWYRTDIPDLRRILERQKTYPQGPL